MDDTTRIADLILIALGIVLAVGSIGSWFSARGRELLRATQKFQGFGVSLEISLPFAVLILGVVLAGSSWIMRVMEDEPEELKRLQTENLELKRGLTEIEARLLEAQEARRLNLTVRLLLPPIVESPPLAEDLECIYRFVNSNIDREAEVWSSLDRERGAYLVKLPNIKAASVIESLFLRDKRTGRRWVLSGMVRASTQIVRLLPVS